MRQVVVTGVGVVAPTGNGLERLWQAIVTGASPIRRITRFDPSSHPSQVAGEVDEEGYEDLVAIRKVRTASHVSRLALAAAELALRDAQLAADTYTRDAFGVTIGTALGGWIDGERQYGLFLERGARRVNPFLVTGACNHCPAIEVASAFGAQGAHVTFSSGCPSSPQAIGHAADLIRSGTLDVCLAGGTESPLTPMGVAALTRTHELSTLNDYPSHAARPFDASHAGMVLSEGSCLLVLEAAECAARRGARVYGEVLGGASSCDAKGLYTFDPTGEAGARAIHRLLERHQVSPSDIDYVCAHANGSPAFDHKEARVLHKAFGEFAARIPVSSIKGVLGHPFGAAGAFQVAATLMAFEHQVIPPTHNLETPDAECALNHVAGAPRPARLRTALVTSYGYGGVNAYLLLRKAD